jgi:hypothetical protein
LRDIERKIEKLEKSNKSDSHIREELQKYFDENNLHPLERTSILFELGLLDAETVIGWIVEGSKKN